MRFRDVLISFSICSYAVAIKMELKLGAMPPRELTRRQAVNDPSSEGGLCGNGVVDEGEDCDCGDSWVCKFSDPCCDYKTCKFLDGAVCDSHDPTQSCCKECQIMSKGTLCRASKDFTCDPEVEFCTGTSGSCPPDVHAPDGTECNGGKTCASGFCTSRLEYCQDWVDSSISGLSSMMDKSRPYKVQGSCYSELLADTPYADVTECEFTCNVLGYTHNGRRTDYCFAPGEREIDESKKYFPEGMECTNPDTPWKISSCINKQCVNTHNTTGAPSSETAPPISPPPNPGFNYNDYTVSKGAIVAYSVGGAVALALIAFVVWFLVRRHRKEDQEIRSTNEKSPALYEGPAVVHGEMSEKAPMPVISEEDEPPKSSHSTRVATGENYPVAHQSSAPVDHGEGSSRMLSEGDIIARPEDAVLRK